MYVYPSPHSISISIQVLGMSPAYVNPKAAVTLYRYASSDLPKRRTMPFRPVRPCLGGILGVGMSDHDNEREIKKKGSSCFLFLVYSINASTPID